jgi:hypothetical protein
MPHTFPAYVTIVATSTPTKVEEGVSKSYVVFLIVVGLALILLGIVLSRRGLRGLKLGGPLSTVSQ